MKVLESERFIPPAISNSAPSADAASSDARNTTAFAISLGCPNLSAERTYELCKKICVILRNLSDSIVG